MFIQYIQTLRDISASSKLLLGVAFLLTCGMFMINPFLITSLGNLNNLGASDIASAIAIGMAVGSLCALLLTYCVKEKALKRAGFVSCLFLSASALLLIFSKYAVGLLCFSLVAVAFVIQRATLNFSTVAARSLQVKLNKNNVDIRMLFLIISLIFSLGSSVGPVAGEYLLGKYSFSGTLYGAAIVFFVCSIAFFLLPKESTNIKHDIYVASSNDNEFRIRPFSIKPYLVCFSYFSIYTVYAQTISYLPLSIKATHSNWTSVTRDFFLVYAISRLVFTIIVFPFAVEKLKKGKSLYVIGTILIGLSMGVLTFTVDYLFLILIAIFFAAGEAFIAAIGIPLLNEQITNETKTTFYIGLYTFCMNALAMGVGQIIGVYAFAHFNIWGTALMWLILSTVSLLLIYPVETKMS